MIVQKVDLYQYFGLTRPENGAGYLYVYAHDCLKNTHPERLRPAMVVIGGGGYTCVSEREKECVALTYCAQGYNAFVLEYSVAPVRYPAQLNEGLMSMVYIRENAKQLGVDADHVAAIGFSAGGHLCAMLATLFDSEDAKAVLSEKISLARPDAVVLSYAVITSGEKAHKGSFISLCGDNTDIIEKLSLENRVKENSSPAFIWTNVDDECVPSENSLYYALACKKNNIPFEIHLFETGDTFHGISIATEEVNSVSEAAQCWIKLSVDWLKRRGFCIIDGVNQ